jgi:serine/threonine protein phosphatase PrpC
VKRFYSQQTFDKALIKTINELPYLNPLIADVNDRHLTFTHSVCEKIGKRSTMEDANFILNIEEGIVAGVFDGHGGEKVSQFVSIKFANRFAKRLNEHKGNVHKTFTNLINEIHSDVCNRINIISGTTAVISFIDKKTSLIYSANLADSVSNIYRKLELNLNQSHFHA